MGDLGCFSFFSNKSISAGEGGLISVKNKRLAKKTKIFTFSWYDATFFRQKVGTNYAI